MRESNARRFAETGADLEAALMEALGASTEGAPSAAGRRRQQNLGGRPPLEPGTATETWKVRAPATLTKVAREAGAQYEGGFSAFVRDAVREKLAAQQPATPDRRG